ncbi:NADPH-dependent F420 reductase [Mesorhizobium sp. WSM3879]|uniref:NADPH-dependent F420 reductase n=1 Tax=Mesorhizobium sp. WSM3879 TaxID=2029406 RepID=UPI000BB01DAC|nr:NADPH-dependent F420 reductase [Mesorhizobium sp. WSM3879]PBB81252.1 NADPH-dependent F420 reductase [Mesorhizobium sp. WSM3879]
MGAFKPTIAIIGGTGALGSGLARRFAGAGYPVIIGSRVADKAEEAARSIAHTAGAPASRGAANEDAAAAADIVLVTVPWESQAAILDAIKPHIVGKLVIDTTVPIQSSRMSRVELPPEGSAAAAARKRLGPEARVVSAFHNVAALKLQRGDDIHCDVLVFGDDVKDRETAIGLAEAMGLRGIHGGPLANSAAAEAMTCVLIGINRAYKVNGSGIRITGIPMAQDVASEPRVGCSDNRQPASQDERH